ncbi:MAG: MarR family winged helix-turn-helix transcriptional regulator [Acetobacteraceae bacterium]
MRDIQHPRRQGLPARNVTSTHLYLREEQVRSAWEATTKAFRQLEKQSDARRMEHGIGKAHQRILILLANRPGLSVGDVQRKLVVSKQSLNRELNLLLRKRYVTCTIDGVDRRVRRLHVTDKGRELADICFEPLRQSLTAAYRQAGAQAVEGFQQVLACLTRDGDET